MQKLIHQEYNTMLKFTNGDNVLLTDHGAINIEKGVALVRTTEFSLNQTLVIKDRWIRRGNHDLLWLPQEYRSCRHAYHNNTIAFGLESGQVSVLDFDFSFELSDK